MFRPPYDGLCRKLVVAIDFGTTFSGVSYSILQPGVVPEILGVNRYPGQESVNGDLKIPTIIWYDQDGKIQAAGAEAKRDGIDIEAELGDWVKAEWFKVYLRPKATDAAQELNKIPPLPLGKTALEIVADFLRYIFACTKTYIEQSHSNGAAILESVEGQTHFVLTHPNGYEGFQQALMREAAVLAGLVPDEEAAESRISLVTEGEASLHYCIQSGLTIDSMKEGNGILIVDAGGGTIDFSSYTQKGDEFAEIAAAECVYNGSVFVTNRARLFFEDLLKESRYEEDVDLITERFDKKTKASFRNVGDNYWIQFSGAREKDAALNIKAGQLRVQGSDIKSFFDPSIKDIIRVVDQQTVAATTKIQSVFLVGGFAASDYLYQSIKEGLQVFDLAVSRPDSHVNKAVAHGAVSYYLDHRVTSRVIKHTFGVPCNLPYQSENKEHDKRKFSKYRSAAGTWYIPGAFDIVLPRNTSVSETREFRRSFARMGKSLDDLRKIKTSITCYRGAEAQPEWVDAEPDMYTTMCTIEADLDELCKSLKPRTASDTTGKEMTFYRADFEIALLFGMTEFKALIIWKDENGEEHRSSSAKVKFNPEDTD